MSITKLTGSMSGNRFENDMIIKWGRIALYRTDIGGLMVKYSGGIMSLLLGFVSLEIDFVGTPTRGFGELGKEVGVGFSIGIDEDKPKSPDIRILFIVFSLLFRLRPRWKKLDVGIDAIPLISRLSQLVFMDISEVHFVNIDPMLYIDWYETRKGYVSFYKLRINLDSKVMVINQITGEDTRLNWVDIELTKIESKYIDDRIRTALIFPSKRMIIKDTSIGSLSKSVT